jgi:glucose-1-phosphate adenylyltransferase
MKTSLPHGSTTLQLTDEKPFIASMGIYLFTRNVLLELLQTQGNDFGRQLIPASLNRYRVSAYLFDGYWADVGTVDSYYDANVQLTQPDAPFSFYDPSCPIYTHQRFLPPSRMLNCEVHNALVSDGSFLDAASVTDSVVGIRTMVRKGTKIRRSVLLGADYYEHETNGASGGSVPLGIGAGVELDRVIVDKNARIGDGARLFNAHGVQEADGNGYYIRNGIIIVPKDATIPHGFSV